LQLEYEDNKLLEYGCVHLANLNRFGNITWSRSICTTNDTQLNETLQDFISNLFSVSKIWLLFYEISSNFV